MSTTSPLLQDKPCYTFSNPLPTDSNGGAGSALARILAPSQIAPFILSCPYCFSQGLRRLHSDCLSKIFCHRWDIVK